MNTDVMFSSASDLWATPQALFDSYNVTHRFTLDAAADETNHKCDDWLGPGGLIEDALSVDWMGRVWLNPPYSMATEFLEHACRQSREHDVGSVILLPSRTDTKWFHTYVWYAPYQCVYPWVKELQFIKGRLKFGSPEGGAVTNSAPFPSLVVTLDGDWT